MNISDYISTSGNVYASCADDGVIGDVAGWVDTGSYVLNALFGADINKGIPGNKIVSFEGVEAVGKSFFVLGACKNFLNSNPNGMVIFFESEGALTKEILRDRGIDLKRFAVLPVVTVQEFKTQCLKIVDKYIEDKKKKGTYPIMFALDSLGMLSTTKEMEDSVSGADTRDMTRAQQIKAAFRVLSLKLAVAGIPMIVTNHVYDSMSMYGGKVASGGGGLKYAGSIIISLTKAKEKDGDSVVGNVITCTAKKSRVTKENSKVKVLIRYDGGLDRHYGLVELAEEAGAIKKVSTRYEFPDGRKVFKKQIDSHPEKFWTKEILDIVNEHIKTTFAYGVPTESDLDEEIEELLDGSLDGSAESEE